MNPSVSDIEIMKRVVKYDSKALELLYDRYSPILYSFIKEIVKEEKAAEDILADIFVKIWERIDQSEFQTDNVYTWMVSFARNNAIAYIKQKRDPSKIVKAEDVPGDKDSLTPKLSPQIKSVSLSEALSMKDNIETALNKLTEAQQFVIHLAYYEGLTEKEISQKLNIPLPTIKSKVKLALSSLKAHLNFKGS